MIKPLDSEDGLVRPNKLFAFGIGEEPIDPSYGFFKV